MKYCNHVTLKLGVASELLLQLGNNKPHHSDFCVVCKANKGTLSIALSLSDCLGPKNGTSILVRVAKLLRLSIFDQIHQKLGLHRAIALI